MNNCTLHDNIAVSGAVAWIAGSSQIISVYFVGCFIYDNYAVAGAVIYSEYIINFYSDSFYSNNTTVS
jgi:hypothetical protein